MPSSILTRGLITQQCLRLGNVCISAGHVARLRRQAVNDGLLAERRFEQFNEPAQFDGLRSAEVEDFISQISSACRR